MSRLRKNFLNTGRGFEQELEMTIAQYARSGVARIEKVSPPTRTVGSGSARRVIYLANPFLDFIGVWTVRSGRAIFIEAKSTSDDRLAVGGAHGFTLDQLAVMREWRRAGGVAVLLWQFKTEVRLFSEPMIERVLAAGKKSLRCSDGVRVDRGLGLAVWDFLEAIAKLDEAGRGEL